MTVNLDIKGMLAKLLATEDLVVEHKKVETACFNVHTRVLTLPMWEKASNSVYTMLVLHEISHSLFTPNEDWSQSTKVPQQFVNVCEDARVEKLCKRKYPGSPKSFYAGYKELTDEDFFQIGDDNLETYNLADRANLYFKIGNFVSLEFNTEEQKIIKLIADAETFDDTLIAAEELYKYCKQNQKEETKISQDDLESQQSGADSQSSPDITDQEEGENNQEQSDETDSYGGTAEKSQQQQSSANNQGGEELEPEVTTMDSLDEALKKLVNHQGTESVYLELPQLDLKKVIVPNAEIHSKCKEQWDCYLKNHDFTKETIFGEVDRNYISFKKSAQNEVNYLVKEFECRKAADSYARSTIARTGILDCSRLHTYKYNEDLFKKVTTLAEGKNHGLVFVLDWSGSMQNVMLDTVKQLFNLIWFCKKVSIPFEVYAFTNDYPLVSYDTIGKANLRQLSYTPKDGLVQVGEWFSMMNLLTSKSNSRTLEEQMKNIFRLACAFGSPYICQFPIPGGLGLSGTPLNESIASLHHILPKFKKENKLQKVQCVILTDGEGSNPKYHREIRRDWDGQKSYLGTAYVGADTFLRDRKTGNTYSLNGNHQDFTNTLLKNLRDKFDDINFIGIRVIEGRDAGYFIRSYCGYHGAEYEKAMSSWKKEKSFSLKNSGYHTYFGISSSTLSQDTEFSVAEDASKSQIKSAFVKSLKSKKMNKRILGEFISLVA